MSRADRILSRARAYPHLPLIGLFAAALLLALVWTDDFGMGADEYVNANVGRQGLRAYTSAEAYADLLERDNLGHHGPSYFMLFAAIGDGLGRIVPAWQPADGRH